MTLYFGNNRSTGACRACGAGFVQVYDFGLCVDCVHVRCRKLDVVAKAENDVYCGKRVRLSDAEIDVIFARLLKSSVTSVNKGKSILRCECISSRTGKQCGSVATRTHEGRNICNSHARGFEISFYNNPKEPPTTETILAGQVADIFKRFPDVRNIVHKIEATQ